MLVLLGVFAVGLCVTSTTVLTVEEQSRIKNQLSQNLPGKDLETTYYNLASLKLLNAPLPKAEVKYCKNHGRRNWEGLSPPKKIVSELGVL